MRKLTRTFVSLGIALGLTAALMLALAQPSRADAYTVNSTDDVDDGTCDTSHCSLREAINAANGNAGADSITFSTGGVITITNGTLTLSDDATSIDGDLDDDGDPEVEVRWSSGTVNDGLIVIQSSNNRIEGLAITDSPAIGVYVDGNGTQADNNQIVNNWVGLDLTSADRGNTTHGIYIWHVAGLTSGAIGNTIQDNVLSGNDRDGLYIRDALETQVLSNTVGLSPDGTATRANGDDGITLNGAVTTTIQGNWVSGNSGDGMYITATQQLTITGNVIGLNSTGGTAGNHGTAGVYMSANVVSATIRGNTVSGNRSNGIYLGPGSTGVVIAGNRIGTDVAGTTGLGNGRTTNRDGIQLNDAYSNTIGGPDLADRNVIAHNGRAGVFISGEQADHNVVQNNYIGTGVNGSEDLGNGDYGSSQDTGDGGIYLYDGADHNVIRDNTIRFNYVGLRFSGGSDSLVTPPQHNQVLTNTLTHNDKYGVVNQTTHWNVTYPTPSGGDNLIQNNAISGTSEGCAYSWCTGIGIFNYGGSPRIAGNTVGQNKTFGIVNRVYFGSDGPDNAADDLLSMPYISGNTISFNGDDGIQSRDTTPLNKATLLGDNTFGNNSGQPHISQRWFVGVEVVSSTQTIDSGLAVTITRQGGGQACPGGACAGSDFAPAGGSDGVWGPSGISYTDVENLSDGTTTWFEVIEYEVNWQGTWTTYTSHLVEVGGDERGSRYFDFDGITTTEEISGEVNLPFCVATGITGTEHALCRYQIGQVPTFASSGDGDWDDDGIPDEEEGTGDTDGDGTPDYQDTDSDGDGIPDEDEYDWCGNPPCDSDGDGTPDYQDTDSDNDGIPDSIEGNVDTDGDGTPDYADADSDDDGIPDDYEYDWCGSAPCDSDGDGTPDYKDDDDDGDGVDTKYEIPDPNGDGDPADAVDNDGDGTPDYLDGDDDGDGIDTKDENPDPNGDGDPSDAQDTDGDGIPDYLEPNDVDTDGDGHYNHDDDDDDGDGKPTAGENADPNGDGNPADAVDSDGDSTPDYLDAEFTIYLPLALRNF